MKKYILFIIIQLLAACSPLPVYVHTAITQTQATWTLTPKVPQETLQTFRFGDLVQTESQALIAAQSSLSPRFNSLEPPTVVEVNPMSYLDYSNFIGTSNDRPTGTHVWLIIYFDNQWRYVSPNPKDTPIPPFRGCLFVAINAADGLTLYAGGPLPLGKISECDN